MAQALSEPHSVWNPSCIHSVFDSKEGLLNSLQLAKLPPTPTSTPTILCCHMSLMLPIAWSPEGSPNQNKSHDAATHGPRTSHHLSKTRQDKTRHDCVG